MARDNPPFQYGSNVGRMIYGVARGKTYLSTGTLPPKVLDENGERDKLAEICMAIDHSINKTAKRVRAVGAAAALAVALGIGAAYANGLDSRPLRWVIPQHEVDSYKRNLQRNLEEGRGTDLGLVSAGTSAMYLGAYGAALWALYAQAEFLRKFSQVRRDQKKIESSNVKTTRILDEEVQEDGLASRIQGVRDNQTREERLNAILHLHSKKGLNNSN